ncbi:MAG: ABC transporter substrate-binding protein [Alphaproteobacteria bacterium]|nr:ABC transporter substrate-binding protein [Alphaproteobacteria bacterium]
MNSSLTRRQFHKTAIAAAAAGAFGAAARPARAADSLVFQTNWLNDPEFCGYMIGIDKGYYADEGLSVTYLSGGPNVIPEGSVIAGKSDVALTSMITTARAIVERKAPLKIIGTQYQKSPIGVVSLASANIQGPKDLVGKTIAVSTLGEGEFKALMKLHNVPLESVRVVPYTFNPAPMINGQVDASWDFVTQLPYLVEQAGKKVNSFLTYDYGFPFYIDLVVVTEQTLNTKRAQLIKFLRASRKGWAENFADPKKYPTMYHDSWFKGLGSTLGAEIYFNTMQQALMDHPKGIYTMTDEAIDRNIEALARVGIKAPRTMFDTTVVPEV